MIDYTLPLDQLPDPLPIEPLTKPFNVTITPPGSKSITCRAYVLAALAEGESKIIRPLRADDTDHLLNALCTLGAEARWVKGENHDGEDVLIKGVAGRFPRGGNLYMGEGGTPTRFMIACACLAKEPVVIDASPRMRERPIAEGVDMLRQLGAKIEYVEAEARLPVRVVPSAEFKGGKLEIEQASSSQFISALLLIAPNLRAGLKLRHKSSILSKSYVDLTVMVLLNAGVRVRHPGDNVPLGLIANRAHERGTDIKRQVLRNIVIEVQADASSALYWFVAGAISDGAKLCMPTFDHGHQPDSICVGLLVQSGARLDLKSNRFQAGSCRRSFVWDFVDCPDGAIAMSVYAASASDTCRLTGLRTLRVKETDRIAALANELRKVGCTVETGEDWISITPPANTSRIKEAASDDQREEDGGRDARSTRSPSSSPISTHSQPKAQGGSSDAASLGGTVGAGSSAPASLGGTVRSRSSDAASTRNSNREPIIIETYNDHRMAMAFAVLGLNAPNGLRLAIRNPKCVAKSYPGFWKDFAKLYQDRQ